MAIQFPSLTHSDYSKIGNYIFLNETSGDRKKLVFWNPKESFPSMGIGHFVWLPANSSITVFTDSFSKFLGFCIEKGIILPKWLQRNQKCPWKNRLDFENTQKGSGAWDLRKVRAFLGFYRKVQAEFILIGFLRELPLIISSLPSNLQEYGIQYCNRLLQSPEGTFALIDYNHFKGNGIKTFQAYNNFGWGLRQVIEDALSKEWKKAPLEIFIQSAKEILKNRVENAPLDKRKIEASFIAGWYKRLDRYLKT